MGVCAVRVNNNKGWCDFKSLAWKNYVTVIWFWHLTMNDETLNDDNNDNYGSYYINDVAVVRSICFMLHAVDCRN